METADAAQLQVGALVMVQSRTQPGMNKQGGVGKVTRVHRQSPETVDVKFVLGGTEKNIDIVSVATHDPFAVSHRPVRVSLSSKMFNLQHAHPTSTPPAPTSLTFQIKGTTLGVSPSCTRQVE